MKSRSVRRTLLAALVPLMLVATTGCGSSEVASADADGVTTVRYAGIGSSGYLPLELADALGYLEDIELDNVGPDEGGPKAIQLVGTRKVDLAHPFNSAIVSAVAAGVKVKAVVGYLGTNEVQRNGFYALPGSGIKSARDLIGKKVGLNALGAAYEAFLDEYLLGRPQPVSFAGERVQLAGLPDAPAPIQGYPVLVQAGSSEAGRNFAGRFGEVVFTAQTTIEQSRAFRDDLRSRVVEHGRSPDSVRVLPGFFSILGSTEEEARRRKDELDDLILPEKILQYVAQWGFDLSGYDLDDPFPVELTLDPAWDGITSRFEMVRGVAERDEPMSIRQFARRISGSRGHAMHVGTPEQVADIFGEWWHADANDGFMIMPSHYPDGFATWVEQVVPLPQARGITRSEYGEGTLRERLGLPQPRFADAEAGVPA